MELVKILISLAPVFTFLLILVLLDSFKLVKPGEIFVSILGGITAAFLALLLNSALLTAFPLERVTFTRYVAPVVEEFLKAGYVFYLIRGHKTGFLVDSAIHGFSVGAGFAFLENLHYLRTVPDATLMLWVIRGFGTAVMHGGTTAIFALITKNRMDQQTRRRYPLFVPGLLAAMAIHSLFNHFLLPPTLTTMIQFAILPSLLLLIFRHSEKNLRQWMDLSLDTDVQMIGFIEQGKFSGTPAGQYLHSLKTHFPGEVVVDMFCLLRLHLELACQAKGILLKKEMGFPVSRDPEISEKLAELSYLRKSIGKTGQMAMAPLLRHNPQDLWEFDFVKKV